MSEGITRLTPIRKRKLILISYNGFTSSLPILKTYTWY